MSAAADCAGPGGLSLSSSVLLRDAAGGCGGDGVDEKELPVEGDAATPTRGPLRPMIASWCAAASGVGGPALGPAEVGGPKGCLAIGKGDGVSSEAAQLQPVQLSADGDELKATRGAARGKGVGGLTALRTWGDRAARAPPPPLADAERGSSREGGGAGECEGCISCAAAGGARR